MRVVIDTNIWVSAFLTNRGHSARLIEAFRAGDFEVVVSEPLLHELGTVLRRPRLMNKYYYDETAITEYIALIKEQSIWVDILGTLNLCRDPRDNFLLETALFGGAEYLVSRDDDLKRDLALIQRMAELGIQVVSVQQFLTRLGSQ
jgi:putative PIN family toxin of toxin-antitoxin system